MMIMMMVMMKINELVFLTACFPHKSRSYAFCLLEILCLSLDLSSC